MITVVVPVGPNPSYRQWLPEAFESVLNQTHLPSELLIIDDAAGITDQDIHNWFNKAPGHWLDWVGELRGTKHWRKELDNHRLTISLWKAPWRIGFSAAFNCAVGLASHDLILYLASDDKLGPYAVRDCLAAYEEHNKLDAWYALTYMVGDEVRTIPINAAMITKGLWRYLGGFPPSAFAGPDALILSCLMVHAPERIIKVSEGNPNYWIREHPDQETHHQASYFLTEMNSIRNLETARFIPNPEWARNL